MTSPPLNLRQYDACADFEKNLRVNDHSEDSSALNISFLEDDVEFKLAEPKSTVVSQPRNFTNYKKKVKPKKIKTPQMTVIYT